MRYGRLQPPGFQPDGTYQPSEYYMELAIQLAEEGIGAGEHPIVAVVTRELGIYTVRHELTEKTNQVVEWQVVLSTAHNNTERGSTRHAEVEALNLAEVRLNRRAIGRSNGVLYTTHEPCPMCAGAIANSKLRGIVYGTSAADAFELAQSKEIKWRNNTVSGLDIIGGRSEVGGAPEQFVIGGFMRDKCLKLLGKVSLV